MGNKTFPDQFVTLSYKREDVLMGQMADTGVIKTGTGELGAFQSLTFCLSKNRTSFVMYAAESQIGTLQKSYAPCFRFSASITLHNRKNHKAAL